MAIKIIGVIPESTDIFVWLCNAGLCGSGVSLFYFQPVSTEVRQFGKQCPQCHSLVMARSSDKTKTAWKSGKPKRWAWSWVPQSWLAWMRLPERRMREGFVGMVKWPLPSLRVGSAVLLMWMSSMDTIHMAPRAARLAPTGFQRAPRPRASRLRLHTQLQSSGGLQLGWSQLCSALLEIRLELGPLSS